MATLPVSEILGTLADEETKALRTVGEAEIVTELPAGTKKIGTVGIADNFAALSAAPVTGAKTVSTTAAEIFAGGSRLSGRYAMVIYNESGNVVYWGPTGITTSNGFPILPGDSVVISFSPSVDTSIFARAASSSAVRVLELK